MRLLAWIEKLPGGMVGAGYVGAQAQVTRVFLTESAAKGWVNAEAKELGVWVHWLEVPPGRAAE